MGKGTRRHSRGPDLSDPTHPFTLEFYEDPQTHTEPVRVWMRSLEPYERKAIGVGLREVLKRDGSEVCGTEWGKQLGGGLFEFRVRHDADEILARVTGRSQRKEPRVRDLALRVFCHAHGSKLILLLAGYDKAREPSAKRQDAEIALARARLREYRRR